MIGFEHWLDVKITLKIEKRKKNMRNKSMGLNSVWLDKQFSIAATTQSNQP